MESDRRKIISEHLPAQGVYELSSAVNAERSLNKAMLSGFYATNPVLTTENLDSLREQEKYSSERIVSSIETQINDINAEYTKALEIGVDPVEAKFRKKIRLDKLSLGILLARRSDGFSYFQGVDVKLYSFETDGGIEQVARNKIEICVPNSEDPNSPHLIETKISNLVSQMQKIHNNPRYNALDFNKEVIKAQKIEIAHESEDAFINRRFLEIEKITELIAFDEQNRDFTRMNTNLKLRQKMTGHLLKIWLDRKINPDPNNRVALRLGFVFGQRSDDDYLEMTAYFNSHIRTLHFPQLDKWFQTGGVSKIMQAMKEKVGIEKPTDYDYVK